MDKPVLQRLSSGSPYYRIKGTMLDVEHGSDGGWRVICPDLQYYPWVQTWFDKTGMDTTTFPTLRTLRETLMTFDEDLPLSDAAVFHTSHFIINGMSYSVTTTKYNPYRINDGRYQTPEFGMIRQHPQGFSLHLRVGLFRRCKKIGIYPTLRSALTAYDEQSWSRTSIWNRIVS